LSGVISRNTYDVSQQLSVDFRDPESKFLLSWAASGIEKMYKRRLASQLPSSFNPSQSDLFQTPTALPRAQHRYRTENAAILETLTHLSHPHTPFSSTGTTTDLNKNKSEDRLGKLHSF
jgi:hypothetical protein